MWRAGHKTRPLWGKAMSTMKRAGVGSGSQSNREETAGADRREGRRRAEGLNGGVFLPLLLLHRRETALVRATEVNVQVQE